MFRELTRKNKQISKDECLEILTNETRGILSVNGDCGYPYGMPMNHFYNSDDGCIYFHCGKHGHKLDSIRRSSKVSLCVCEKGQKDDGDWAFNVRSVIVFGTIEMIDDLSNIIEITRKLCYKFTDDNEYIEHEIKNFSNETLLLKLTPEHICGKRIKEA